MPGRARVRGYVDHAGLRAGGGEPRARSCTTSRPRTTWSSPRSSTSPRSAAPSWRPPRPGAAGRAAAHPRGAADARPTTSRRRSSPPRSSSGSRPAPTSSCSPRSAPLEQRVGRETHRLTVELLGADESRARRPRARAGDPRPGARPRPRQHDHRRHPPPRAASSTAGPHARRDLKETVMTPARRPARRPRRSRATSSGTPSPASTPTAGDARPPPPAGRVATQVAHLLWTDEVARRVAATRQGRLGRARRWSRSQDPTGYVDAAGARGRPALAARRCSPAGARRARRCRPRCGRCPTARRCRGSARRCRRRRWRPRGSWRPGRTRSTCTTRSASSPSSSDRIRHVAHLGVRTRDFAFSVHELPAPAEEFRIDLVSPSGDQWSWGPEDAAQTVTGSAWDFCLLVTQRVHRDDTDLVAVGRGRRAVADDRPGLRRPAAGPARDGRAK